MHLNLEQLEIVFEHAATQYPQISRPAWMEFARIMLPSPYDNLDPDVSTDLKRRLLLGALSADYGRSSPVSVVDRGVKPLGLDITADENGILVHLDGSHVPIKYALGSALTIKQLVFGNMTWDVLGPLPPHIIERFNHSWYYANSAQAIASGILAERLINVGPERALPKPTPSKPTIRLTVSQLAFILQLEALTSPRTIHDSDVDCYTKRLGHVLWLDDKTQFDAVLDARKLATARSKISNQLLQSDRERAIKLGLHLRICIDMRLTIKPQLRTVTELLDSLKAADRALVQQRYQFLQDLLTRTKYNGCIHARLTAAQILARPDEFIGNITDDHNVICKLCGLTLMCEHTLAMHASHLGAALAERELPALNSFLRRQERLTLCKVCGEVIREDLFDDDQYVMPQDPDYRRITYSRIMTYKDLVKPGKKSTSDNMMMALLYEPVMRQFGFIDSIRAMTPEHREIMQRLYVDVYLLAAYGLLGYKIGGPDSSARSAPGGNGSAIEALLNTIRLRQGSAMAAIGFNDKSLLMILSEAVRSVKNLIAHQEDILVPNRDVTDANCYALLKFAAYGSTWRSDMAITTVEDAAAALGGASIRAKISTFSPSWQFIAKLWLGEGRDHTLYEQSVRAEAQLRRSYPPRYCTQYREPIFRRSGPEHYDGFYHRGPLDIAALFDATGKSIRGTFDPAVTSLDTIEWTKRWITGLDTPFTLLTHDDSDEAKLRAIAAAVVRRQTHETFVETFLQICPAKPSTVHDWSGPKQQCLYCKATIEDVFNSDEYFDRYEPQMRRTEIRPWSPRPHITFDALSVKAPLDIEQLIASAVKKLSPLLEKATIITSPTYLFELGNLSGRIYESIGVRSIDGGNELSDGHWSETRYYALYAYLQQLFTNLNYIITYADQGAVVKRPDLIAFARAHPKLPSGLRNISNQVQLRLQRWHADRIETPLVAGPLLCLDLLNSMHDCFEFAPLGVFLCREIMQNDRYTSVFNRLDYIADGRENDLETFNDADGDAFRFNEVTAASDPLYQDFIFDHVE